MIINEKYRNLWEKIQRFQLDDPNASITFTDKLISEQQWSRKFAHKAIEEYKRFMLLCVVLPNGASPSYVVDQVWHLHLTYTQSYWVDFCRNTLGKDVHHFPSKGGSEEDSKHVLWYLDTLAQYEAIFTEKAPQDVWPNKDLPVRDKQPDVNKINRILIGIAIGAPMLIGLVFFQQFNVFALRGPSFLGFYFLAALAGFFLFSWYTEKLIRLRKVGLAQQIPMYLNAFQVANFMRDEVFAARCAIVNLVDANKLEVNDKSSYTVLLDPEVQSEEYRINPLHSKLCEYKQGDVVKHWQLEQAVYAKNLRTELDKVIAFKFDLLSYLPYFILLGLGVCRCIQGYVNGRPITFLVVLMVLMSIVFYILAQVKQSDFEDAVKEEVKVKYKSLWKDDENYTVARDFALFGHKMLYLLPAMALVSSQFWPSSSDAGGSSSGGCSSGGDSGCGGGGCGGCGGGGD